MGFAFFGQKIAMSVSVGAWWGWSGRFLILLYKLWVLYFIAASCRMMAKMVVRGRFGKAAWQKGGLWDWWWFCL